MFKFIFKMFIAVIGFIGLNANANPLNEVQLKCVSIKNQKCKVRPAIMNINSNELLFYPYSILVNKCSGSCNDINNPYPKLCVSKYQSIKISKYLIQESKKFIKELMKQDIYLDMRLVHVNVD